MFRRKGEDTLFDTNTDHADGSAASTDAGSSTAASSTVTASANSAAGTISTAPAASSYTTAPIPRSMPEARSNPTPPVSGFRSGTSAMGSDMGGRSRMQETKASTSPASGIGIEKSNKSGRRVLTVGNDILLKGEIATCDRLVIEGKVDATLNDVHTVEIAETGSFKGSANIEDAEISGLFEGDLVVRNRLVIYATGKVRGKISYGEIEIERGGELTGEIKTTNPQATAGSRSARGSKVDDKVTA